MPRGPPWVPGLAVACLLASTLVAAEADGRARTGKLEEQGFQVPFECVQASEEASGPRVHIVSCPACVPCVRVVGLVAHAASGCVCERE